MKKLFTLLIAVLYIVNLQAQENGNVTVHLGEGASLESLLAGYEKESIETVVITGTPTLDDYAYMRTQEFFNKSGYVEDVGRVMKLDMKNAAVDSIPAKAFYALHIHNYQKLHIVFPESLTYVGDSAFADCKKWFFYFEFEFTGPFPKIGKEPCSAENIENTTLCHWKVSADNAYCVEVEEEDVEYWGIYSADKKEFHAKSVAAHWRFEVLPGTEIISDNAFSYRELSDEVVIPESVEYIGNYAFESIRLFISSNDDVFKLGIICMRNEPPMLGKEVFANNEYFSRYIYIFVPDESVELYRNAEGWKDAPFKIYPLSEKGYYAGVASIESTLYDNPGKNTNVIYDLQGRTLKSVPQRGIYIKNGKKYVK